MTTPISVPVVAGTEATAAEYNSIVTDLITAFSGNFSNLDPAVLLAYAAL
jgi:hypothetical protein